MTNMRFGPDGLIYAWDGQNVWQQAGVNVDVLQATRAVWHRAVDRLRRRPDQLLAKWPNDLDRQRGRRKRFQWRKQRARYTMPAVGGVATLAGTLQFHQDFVPAPLRRRCPTRRRSFWSIAVRRTSRRAAWTCLISSLARRAAHPEHPRASASITFDLATGFTLALDSGRIAGKSAASRCRCWTLAAAGMPLDWTAGQLINAADNNGGSGMFLDARGKLFVGGPDGVTVFDPTGAAQSYSTGPSTFPVVFRNATNDQFSLTLGGFSDPMNLGSSPRIYLAADFTVPVPTAIAWTGDATAIGRTARDGISRPRPTALTSGPCLGRT